MIRYTLEATGKIISSLSGDRNMVDLNTPSDAIYIDSDSAVNMSDYWDFGLRQFVSIGMSPSKYHRFDYNLKQWLDNRNIFELRDQKWIQLKQQRNAFEFGGFLFDGNIYDSDQVSQGRILGAVLAGLPQIWTLANNTTVSLSAEQLKSLYAALQMHVAIAHERGRIAREAIQAATTKEQIEAIVF